MGNQPHRRRLPRQADGTGDLSGVVGCGIVGFVDTVGGYLLVLDNGIGFRGHGGFGNIVLHLEGEGDRGGIAVGILAVDRDDGLIGGLVATVEGDARSA